MDELKSVTALFRKRRNKLVAHKDLESVSQAGGELQPYAEAGTQATQAVPTGS